MTVRTSANGGQAIALITDGGDIDIKNGSTVDAFAEGEVSAAFSTRNDRPNEKGGHIYISDSVVKAIARYVENGDGPIPYSENQDGETRREPQGENIGIIAQTSEGVTPAVISIIRSKVTAEGDTAAIFARAMSADGKTIGTIKIENAAIQTPEGGKVIDYRKLRDGIYEAGHGRRHGRLPLYQSSRQKYDHRTSRGSQAGRPQARRDQARRKQARGVQAEPQA